MFDLIVSCVSLKKFLNEIFDSLVPVIGLAGVVAEVLDVSNVHMLDLK